MIDEVAQFYEGMDFEIVYEEMDFEIGRRIEDLQALATRLRVTYGCVEHVDFSPFRQGPLRPAPGFGAIALQYRASTSVEPARTPAGPSMGSRGARPPRRCFGTSSVASR